MFQCCICVCYVLIENLMLTYLKLLECLSVRIPIAHDSDRSFCPILLKFEMHVRYVMSLTKTKFHGQNTGSSKRACASTQFTSGFADFTLVPTVHHNAPSSRPILIQFGT